MINFKYKGPVGAGKSHNFFHIIEYLCYYTTPQPKELGSDIYDLMSKSALLLKIMGSVFRTNNVESHCNTLLLSISYSEDNTINSFCIDSNILDMTLPFSENGRSFSILHSLISCANNDIRKNIDLTESETTLNFFEKYLKKIDNKTKEAFKLKDFEMWTKFHSLLNYFKFEKNEIYDILRLFTLIIHCNDAPISKKKVGHNKEEYFLNKTGFLKKLVKNLSIGSETEFTDKFGVYSNIEELKSGLIKLMKYTYYIIFEFIKLKINNFISNFFQLKCSQNNNIKKPNKKNKKLYILDMPGQVEDQTLGGLIINLANECRFISSSAHYLSFLEKLEEDHLNINTFKKLHCVSLVNALLGKDGLFKLLSKTLPEYFFEYQKTNKIVGVLEFSSNKVDDNEIKPRDYAFKIKFSEKSNVFNYFALHTEGKSLILNRNLIELLNCSKSPVIRCVANNLQDYFIESKSLYKVVQSEFIKIFKNIEGINPFVIYSIHSNNSLKYNYFESASGKLLSYNLTFNILQKSITKTKLDGSYLWH